MNFFLSLHNLSTRFDSILSEWGWAAGGLVVRVFVATQFFKAGLVKINDWDSTLALFREEYTVPLLSPEIAAVLGAGGELLLPVLLTLGLFSRPAALGLFVVNAMAVLSYPQLLSFDCPAAINDHFYWGVLLLVVTLAGPGKVTLDAYLNRMHSRQA